MSISSTVMTRIIRHARSQHGLVTSEQLRTLEVSRKVVRTKVAKGEWMLAAIGVYRLGGAPVTWESELMAQVLAGGQQAVASHRAAATLWDIGDLPRGRPEITIPRGRRYWPAGSACMRARIVTWSSLYCGLEFRLRRSNERCST